MKVLISFLVCLVVVGCGESAEERIAKEAAKLRATAEANRKANPPPKPSWDKPLTKEELKEVIEAKIRDRAGKSTGKLTKAELEKVTTLNLDSIRLTEVKELEKLTQLQKLILQYNQLTKIPKGLENLTPLTFRNLNSNKLTSVKGLENLTQLKELYLNDNPDLTKAQIAQLQKALPKCNIVHNTKK